MPTVLFAAILAAALPLADRSHPAAEHCAPEQAQVAVLGMYHFVSEQNLVTQADDDELAPERQAQIATLVDRLAAFAPTRIAVERPYDQAELDRRYAAYRRGDYRLTAEETDQIAFRLGARLGVPRLDWVQYRGAFPFDAVQAFAAARGRTDALEAALAGARALAAELDRVLRAEGVVAALRFFNSPEALAANHRTYLLLNRFADTANPSGGERPGPALVESWYGTNLNIFANLQAIATPGARVLVVYGQGHARILNGLIEDDPALCRIDAAALLAAPD